MRGETLDIKPIVLRRDLRSALQDILRQYFGRNLKIVKLDHRISDYCSSFILEELDVTLDDGMELALIFKDLSKTALMKGAGRVKPTFFYNPVREIETYRRVLVNHRLGTPICYGAVVEPGMHRFWLFLERLPPVLLWQMGELERWKDVARWLAGMHTYLVRETEVRESAHIAHLLDYDGPFYLRWIERAVSFVCEGDKSAAQNHAKAIRWLQSRYAKVVEKLASLPVTVIHGEFFASNILLHQNGKHLRVCPVDWEMAAVGPGGVDLAGLTSGGWTQQQKDEMALAYHAALPDGSPAKTAPQKFLKNLEYCRLHQAVQWLGWSPLWEPPSEHAHDWLKEAIRAAESLNL